MLDLVGCTEPLLHTWGFEWDERNAWSAGPPSSVRLLPPHASTHSLLYLEGIKSIGAGCGGREKTNCWFILLKAQKVMEGTKIRPQEREIGILWEVIYRVEIDERYWPLAFAPGFRSKLPSFVLLQSARYLLTSLTLAVADTSFSFQMGNGFLLLGT